MRSSVQPTPVDTPIFFASTRHSHISASRDLHVRSTGREVQPGLNDVHRMSSNTSDSWRSPFASPDPMSIDIDAASSMILSDMPILLSNKQERASHQAKSTQSISPLNQQASTRANEAPEAVLAPLVRTSVDEVHEAKQTELQQSLAMFVENPMQSNAEQSTTSAVEKDSYAIPLRRQISHKRAQGWPPPSTSHMETQTPIFRPGKHAPSSSLVASPVSASKQQSTLGRGIYPRAILESSANDSTHSKFGQRDSELITTSFQLGRESNDSPGMAIAPSQAPSRTSREAHGSRAGLTQIHHVPRAAPKLISAIILASEYPASQNLKSLLIIAEAENALHRTTIACRQVMTKRPAARSRPSTRNSDLGFEIDKEEIIKAIVNCWNDGRWNEADLCIKSTLKKMPVQAVPCTITRRLHHLRGVIPSLTGEWNEALTKFLSVLKTPLRDSAQLDAILMLFSVVALKLIYPTRLQSRARSSTVPTPTSSINAFR
ncbi:uncharacterized protein MYCFIDRAFT_177976 [Pseudocercospora fijiensis CIRAD86]|uniref:Uncharacterized protein n=1 Tax=Pseudocercospora fijiensis (strain CIRAD86) TaxID=383855 RepID=M2YNS0_PSEFD|nr:uncharacterized protein MYCFIDRAFT_177976 [Pseudocercospora fijiensis CIRAD86]EME79375.1 hypothetical protein MYCFIDRAFT_177976 [Pseudocercospora fijiensis CIRAD86]